MFPASMRKKKITPPKFELHWSHVFGQDLWKTSKKIMTPVKFERQWSHIFVLGWPDKKIEIPNFCFATAKKNVTPLKCELHWSHIFGKTCGRLAKKYDASEVRTSVGSFFLVGLTGKNSKSRTVVSPRPKKHDSTEVRTSLESYFLPRLVED